MSRGGIRAPPANATRPPAGGAPGDAGRVEELAERQERDEQPGPGEAQPEHGVEGEGPRFETHEAEDELAGRAERTRVDVAEPRSASRDDEDEKQHRVIGRNGDVANAHDEEAPGEEEVANAAADQVRLEPRLVEPSEDLPVDPGGWGEMPCSGAGATSGVRSSEQGS